MRAVVIEGELTEITGRERTHGEDIHARERELQQPGRVALQQRIANADDHHINSLLAQLRGILRLDDSSEDVLLLALIESAADYASRYLARSLLTQSRTIQIDAPMNRGLSQSNLKYPTVLLIYPPVVAITRVYTQYDDGTTEDIDAAGYWLDAVSDPPELHVSAGWAELLRVNYTCGYGSDYGSLPVAIQRGILLHAAYLYKFRGDCPDGEAAEKSGAVAAYRTYRMVRR